MAEEGVRVLAMGVVFIPRYGLYEPPPVANPPQAEKGPLLPLPEALELSLISPSISPVFWKLRNQQHRTSEQAAISSFAKFSMKGTGGKSVETCKLATNEEN